MPFSSNGRRTYAYLNENTFSYFFTKLRTGICRWTTFQEREAGMISLRLGADWRNDQLRTIGCPHPLQVEVQFTWVFIDIIGEIYQWWTWRVRFDIVLWRFVYLQDKNIPAYFIGNYFWIELEKKDLKGLHFLQRYRISCPSVRRKLPKIAGKILLIERLHPSRSWQRVFLERNQLQPVDRRIL